MTCRAIIFPCQYFAGRAVPLFFHAMIFHAGPCHKSPGPPFRAVPGRPCHQKFPKLNKLGPVELNFRTSASGLVCSFALLIYITPCGVSDTLVRGEI